MPTLPALSSRPEWPVFSRTPPFGVPATQRRDRGALSARKRKQVGETPFLA